MLIIYLKCNLANCQAEKLENINRQNMRPSEIKVVPISIICTQNKREVQFNGPFCLQLVLWHNSQLSDKVHIPSFCRVTSHALLKLFFSPKNYKLTNCFDSKLFLNNCFWIIHVLIGFFEFWWLLNFFLSNSKCNFFYII